MRHSRYIIRLLVLRLFLPLVFAGICLSPRPLAATYYVSPTGGGSGTATNAPAKGTVEQLGLWLGNTNADHLDLTVVFLPGIYSLVRTNAHFDWLVITGDTNRSVTLCGQLAADGSRPRLIMQPTSWAPTRG